MITIVSTSCARLLDDGFCMKWPLEVTWPLSSSGRKWGESKKKKILLFGRQIEGKIKGTGLFSYNISSLWFAGSVWNTN